MSASSETAKALRDYARRFEADPDLQIEQFLDDRPGIDRGEALPALILLDMKLRYEKGLSVPFEAHFDRFMSVLRPAEPAPAAATVRLDDVHEAETEAMEPDAASAAAAPGPPPDPESADELNEILGTARFEMLERLGRGGFGTVFLARDHDLHRFVACKLSRHSASTLEDYIREARVLARLDHPNIVPIYDVMRTEDGRVAIITKYIQGRDLGDALGSEAFGFSQIAHIVQLVAEALHYAHLHGIVHRDVKPANILIDDAGVPHVTDFGIALTHTSVDRNRLLFGTPSYMSPEQARGDGDLVDGRSDVFSLGTVLYRMLTGTLPFEGEGHEALERVLRQEARPPRALDERIPVELERVCMKALSKHIGDRYATAADMAGELKQCRTYTPDPLDVSDVRLPESLRELEELLAENNHDVWAAQRIAEGWEYGNFRDDVRKIHPDLVPYDQLSEGEKEYDRKTVEGALKLILKHGFRIEPPED
ncbi:MAG: protein kinase [Wenzhouxiangellaceae bacterium]|nr:protein kinase [Wenzhouxiangellaceae bacterium]